ncbi:hypothetical protein N431DRAFT_437858 [Stipitochalara longipes BDJ]|nr:hypothetical protein N431DRAFT_437858 [Stipitochalara longipes BDJ]
MHSWFSGKISASHALAPGSIPGGCTATSVFLGFVCLRGLQDPFFVLFATCAVQARIH